MRVQDLIEKRSQPALNPRIEPLDQLRQCVNEHGDDLFVSFTQGFGRNQYPKLGVNPRSTFKTPLGIYCYRASVVIEHTEAELAGVHQHGEDNGGLIAPFTGGNAWHNAWVFKLDQTNALLSSMSPAEYDRKIEILKTMWTGSDNEFVDFIAIAESTALRREHVWYFWNVTRRMMGYLSSHTNPKISVWNQVMRKCGYTMALDDGLGWIHPNEPEQAVVFDPRIIKPVDIIRRSEGQSILRHGMQKRSDQNPLLLSQIPPEVIARLATPVARNILDNYLSRAEDYGVAPSVSVGNSFLDKLGNDVCGEISADFANIGDSVASLIGWHGVFKSKRYDRLNRRGIKMLLHPDLHQNKIDNKLCDKIAKIFFRDATILSLDNENDMIADLVIHLMKEPDRFVNFQHFVRLFSNRDRLEGRYIEASQLADSLRSKDS